MVFKSNMRRYKKRNFRRFKRNMVKSKYSKNLGVYKKHNKYTPALVRELGGFPERYICKLKLAGTPVQIPGSATMSAFASGVIPLNWFANSTDAKLPLGFQTLRLIYDEFCVTACKLSIKIFNTNPIPLKIVTVPIDNDDNLWQTPGSVGNYYQAAANPKSRQRVINSGTNTSNNIMFHNHYVSVKNIAGQKVNSTNSELCGFTGSPNSGTSFTNPVDVYDFFYQVNAYDDSSQLNQSGKLFFTVETTFYIEFFSRLSTLQCEDIDMTGGVIDDPAYVITKKKYAV